MKTGPETQSELMNEKSCKKEEAPITTPRWSDRLGWSLPKLEREDRLDLVSRVEAGAHGGVDYNVMMVLSAGLASIGLLQGSVAVIIGAMLVAPLMGPLIGAGLALVQGNARLFRKAVGVTVLGIGLAFLVSLLIGALNPGFEPSLELESRGTPDILDLGVAILSGFVAAYAMGRPGVAGTLAGVAIASALVPPLAVVGIGITNDRPIVAGNSAILLITNVVAIILAAALAFRLFGINQVRDRSRVSAWVGKTIKILVMIVIILLAPLIVHLLETRRTGQDRPLTHPVAAPVRDAVQKFADGHPGIRVMATARSSVEPESGITVVLAASGEVPAGLTEELETIITDARGGDPVVRIFVLQEAPKAQ